MYHLATGASHVLAGTRSCSSHGVPPHGHAHSFARGLPRRLPRGCRFTESRCQHEQQPCPVMAEGGHCGYQCRMQHMTALHGSLLHAWGPILSVSALSGVRRRSNALSGFGAAVGEGEELMEIEWTDEAGILDAEGAMHADVEELLELAHCGAGPQEARCGPGAEARQRMRFACVLTAPESCGLSLTSSHLRPTVIACRCGLGEKRVCLDWRMPGRWRRTPGTGCTLRERETVTVWADCGTFDWDRYLASPWPADRGSKCMLQSVRTRASYIDLAIADLWPISDRCCQEHAVRAGWIAGASWRSGSMWRRGGSAASSAWCLRRAAAGST